MDTTAERHIRRDAAAVAKGKRPLLPTNDSYSVDSRELQTAAWWPAPDASDLPMVGDIKWSGKQDGEGSRRLSGEIHVNPDLKPGFQVPEFKTYVRFNSFNTVSS
jgi:hypothetical protein